MKFELKRIPRGQNSGKGFFISTFRFDLALAQDIEKVALANGLSISSVINQVLQQFVDSVEIPTDISPVKTLHPTTWGKEKEAEVVTLKTKPKAAKPAKVEEEKPKKRRGRPPKEKPVEKEEAVEAKPAKKKAVEEPVVKKVAAASVLSKLKRKPVDLDDAVPDDD